MPSRYYPKGQRHFGHYTKGYKWMTHDLKNYEGPFHYFGDYDLVQTGAFPSDESRLLKPYKDLLNRDNRDVLVYDSLTLINLYDFKSPITRLPGPGPNDVKNGYMMRYFIKQKNDITKPVIEIDEKQYKKVKAKDGANINGYLYDKLSLRWKIKGPRKDQFTDRTKKVVRIYGVEDSNRRTVFAKNMKMPGLSDALRDLTQHSEHNQIQSQGAAGIQQNNLETDGTEFVLENGTPYIGFYHIHPTLGPMRGKKHSDKIAHDRLMTPGEYAMAKARSKDTSSGPAGGNSSGY